MSCNKVLGIVGMPGSGKSVAATKGKEFGFSIFVMGDVIREEVVRRGLDPTPEHMGQVMLRLRNEKGAAIVAQMCLDRVEQSESQRILIEGVRSMDEVHEFRKHLPTFKLLSIHASPTKRFFRIFERGRSDDSLNERIFNERDERELRVGIGSVIALADYMIINDGTLSQFKLKVSNFFEEYLLEKNKFDCRG